MAEIHQINTDTRSDEQKAWDNYNIVAESCGLPIAKVFSPSRKRALKARLALIGLEGWNQALENLEKATWMHGQNDSGRNWRANIDFMLQESSLVKLYEGIYNAE